MRLHVYFFNAMFCRDISSYQVLWPQTHTRNEFKFVQRAFSSNDSWYGNTLLARVITRNFLYATHWKYQLGYCFYWCQFPDGESTIQIQIQCTQSTTYNAIVVLHERKQARTCCMEYVFLWFVCLDIFQYNSNFYGALAFG